MTRTRSARNAGRHRATGAAGELSVEAAIGASVALAVAVTEHAAPQPAPGPTTRWVPVAAAFVPVPAT